MHAVDESARERLEYLRGELRAERISWGELAELQGLAAHIAPDDVELLEAAGIPEDEDCGSCGARIGPNGAFPWHLPDEDCRAIRPPVLTDQRGA
jgi:hypothetical protein